MAKEPKMKIGIGANTGDFEKGARKVKQEMRDLDKVSSGALASIGSALGVDTGKIQQFSSALAGLGNKFQQTGMAGQQAFGNVLKSIAPVAGALAGLGIAGVTMAFKELNSEAETFKKTVAGANMEMATAAYIDTYRQALRDMHADTGKAVAETQSSWKKFWGTMGANMKEYFRSGAFAESLIRGEGGTVTGEGLQSYNNAITTATQKAQAAADITNKIYELERKRKEQAIEIARINAQIQDKLSIARDATASLSARQTAVAEAEALIAQKKNLQVPLEKQLADLYQERSSLATDSVEAADATLAQQQRAFDVERALTQESNSLLRVKNSIATVSQAAAAAAAAERAEVERIAALRAQDGANPLTALPGISTGAVVQVPTALLPPKKEDVDYYKNVVSASIGGVEVHIGFKTDVDELRDITGEVTSIIEGFTASMASAIGELTANLINGENPWMNFGNAAVSAFGDMAVAIGKIAIQAGVAALGIDAMLKTPAAGGIAIAAGVALVALGQAVKAGMANIANGNYSSSQGAYSNTTSSYGSDYEQREVYVNVTGTLQADGDALVAVINNSL